MAAGWPAGNKPEDERAFGQFPMSRKPELEAAAKKDLEAGHTLTPMIMELKTDAGELEYEVLDGPRCDHTCSACRSQIDELASEFGSGAIGVFGDSSGGEMERLRRELRALANTIRTALPGRAAPELGEGGSIENEGKGVFMVTEGKPR